MGVLTIGLKQDMLIIAVGVESNLVFDQKREKFHIGVDGYFDEYIHAVISRNFNIVMAVSAYTIYIHPELRI